jgi:hypothetical protein
VPVPMPMSGGEMSKPFTARLAVELIPLKPLVLQP